VYHGSKPGLFLIFRWDGAGLAGSGEIVLLEEEKPMFQPLHIHGHLSRLLFMLRAGDPIVKLIWIVPKGWHAELDRIVFPWVQMWKTAFDVNLPLIEYRNANGTFLGDLGTSRSSRRSSPAPPKSPADKIKARESKTYQILR
jgi:hypothetical protein